MEEKWSTIKDFEDYQISTKGRVKSFKQDKINGKIMSFGSSGSYLTVVLRKNNKPYNKYVHRLVAEAFIENPNGLEIVNHKDENPHNNVVENLEWCDVQYNNTYNKVRERTSETRSKQEIPHRRAVKCIETNKIYDSMIQAAKDIGGIDTGVRRACIGERKTYKGYHWQFI